MPLIWLIPKCQYHRIFKIFISKISGIPGPLKEAAKRFDAKKFMKAMEKGVRKAVEIRIKRFVNGNMATVPENSPAQAQKEFFTLDVMLLAYAIAAGVVTNEDQQALAQALNRQNGEFKWQGKVLGQELGEWVRGFLARQAKEQRKQSFMAWFRRF